jgi:energy-coupling factor transport system permease protein
MPVKKPGSHFKFFLAIVAFILVIQTLFGPGERYILKPLIPEAIPFAGGKGSLKWDGLALGIVTGFRLISLALLMSMLTASTPPRLLAQGLVRLGLGYRAAYIITTAFNFIPAFEEEARMIMNARKLRGMRAGEEGGLFARLTEYSAMAVPLIIGAMRKAQLSAAAMDARAFGAYKTKTWLDSITMSPSDFAALALGAIFSALAVVLNCLLPSAILLLSNSG